MAQPAIRSLTAITLVLALLVTTSLASTEIPYATDGKEADVTAEAIIADTIVLRPLGFAATIAGTAVFIVALPFSLLTKSVDKTAQKLVVAPAKYTFTRPLGQVSD